MIATLSLVVAASTASAGEAPPPLGAIVNADVLVYGATAAGCVAAIAASRSGARNVAVATPYGFIGGMTTGGIMHVDGANSTVIQGITREFFERVVSRYPQHPPLPPRPAAYSFACRAGRCIEQDDVPGSSTGDTCSSLCAPLAANEWLANTLISTLSADNRTLTVSLPVGQTHSFIKKSEKGIKYLNTSVGAGMVRKVQDGQVLSLGRPAVAADQEYLLIELAPTTAAADAAADAAAGMGHPSLPPLPPAPRPHAIGCPPLRDCWMYGSGVAERVLEEMLDEANVTVVRKLIGLAGATKAGTQLESVTAEDGTTLRAKVWIDGSYEGDLAWVGGTEMVWGRESRAQYGEHGAGRRPAIHFNPGVDPFWPDGSVIPHIHTEPTPVTELYRADERVEAYDFRLCVTNSPGHRLPFTKPASYNASEFEYWRRMYKIHPPTEIPIGTCLGPIPNNYSDCGESPCVKCDILGMKFGTDMLNGAWGYPNGTTAQRTTIREAHIQYILGLLWFWQSDPSINQTLREEVSALGFCTDEYTGDSGFPNDPPHWPYRLRDNIHTDVPLYQLYVREARRMVGDFIWTEAMVSEDMRRQRSVGLGSYSFDVHWVTRFVDDNVTLGQRPSIAMEGRVNDHRQGNVTSQAFSIPYDALLPKRTELTNVLVPVAASMSHVRQNAVRMEPTWMIMGQASGVAAAMAIRASGAVHDVNVLQLQRTLLTQKQMIWP